jgi:hypothetical protein
MDCRAVLAAHSTDEAGIGAQPTLWREGDDCLVTELFEGTMVGKPSPRTAGSRTCRGSAHGLPQSPTRALLCRARDRTWDDLAKVVAARRDVQRSTHPANREHGNVLSNERELHCFSFVKNEAAALKMSRSCRSCRTSRRRCVSSSFSAVVSASAGPLPASMSACFSQSRAQRQLRQVQVLRHLGDVPVPAAAQSNGLRLDSGPNFLRALLFAMGHSRRTIARFWVSTTSG